MASQEETASMMPGQTFDTEIASAPPSPAKRTAADEHDPEALTAADAESRRKATEEALTQLRDDVTILGIGCCVTNKHDARIWYIHPDGRFRKSWDMFQSALLIYVAISVPFRLGLSIETQVLTGDWFWELFVDLYFITDIVLNFRTGVYDGDGTLIHDRVKIRQRYLRGWFSIDIISCFPAGYIAQIVAAASGEGGSGGKIGNMKGIRILRLLRLAKMLRLGRLKRIFVRYAEELQPVIKLVKLLGMVTAGGFTAHILACMWYYVGFGYDDILADGFLQHGWIREYHGCMEDEEPPLGNCTGRWGVNLSAGEKISAGDAYLVSFYWAVTTLTTIGYGDISPRTEAEKFLGIFAMAVGSFFFGMLVGSLSAHITSGNLGEQEHRMKMEKIREFMKTHEVDTPLKRRVIAYMDNYYLHKTPFTEIEILGEKDSRVLPAAMDRELKSAMYKSFIKQLPLVQGLDYDVQMAVVQKMRPIEFAQGDAVTKEGDPGLDLFVVVTGSVTVMKDGELVMDHNGQPVYLEKGAVFGEEPLLQIGMGAQGSLRPETHIASSQLELRTLSNVDMFALMEKYDGLVQAVVNYVLQREKRKRAQGGRQTLTGTTSISMGQLERLAKKKVVKPRKMSVANLLGEKKSAKDGKGIPPTPAKISPRQVLPPLGGGKQQPPSPQPLQEASDDEFGGVTDDPDIMPPPSPSSRTGSGVVDNALMNKLLQDNAKQAARLVHIESMLTQLLNK